MKKSVCVSLSKVNFASGKITSIFQVKLIVITNRNVEQISGDVAYCLSVNESLDTCLIFFL